MDYRWRHADGYGRDVPVVGVSGADGGFDDQEEAEAWLARNWEALAEAGVEQVTLLRVGAEVYGPMSLKPVR